MALENELISNYSDYKNNPILNSIMYIKTEKMKNIFNIDVHRVDKRYIQR